MITTEITNKQLNFKKILYQSQREKELQLRQQQLQNAFHNASQTQQNAVNSTAPVRDFVEINDDDEDREDRLVIDLNDDSEVKSTIAKSLPIIDADSKTDSVEFSAGSIKRANIGFNLRHENTPNDIPKFIYLTSDSENSNGSVKIDILTPINREKQSHLNPLLAQQQRRSLPQRRMTMDDRQIVNLKKNEKTTNELDTINIEIDNLVNYKSDRIIDLLKDLVNGRIGSAEFSKKMKSDCDISWKDLHVLTNNLTKNHHFQIKKDRVNSPKLNFLNFPTTASDLVGYFESVRQHLNKQQFLDTMKFYQLIVKELLNLNKTKIIQYLLEFLIIRRNTNNVNVLNLSCPKNQQKATVSSTTPYTKPLVKIQDKKVENLNDVIFRQCDSNLFCINRTNLIYTSPKTKNNSHTKYVCEIKPSCKEQKRQPKMAPLVPQVSQVNTNSGSSMPIPHTVTGGLRISTKLMPSPVKNNHHVNKTVESNERDISSNVSNHRDRIAPNSYPLLSAPYSYRYKPTTILTQQQQPQQPQQPPLPSTQTHTQMPTHAPIYHHNSHNATIAQQPPDQSPVSLQRKLHLKYKQKSPKYTEPIQNHHPYYYPAPPPSYFYHPYYYTNYPPSHHMPEPITADNSNHNQPVYEANINHNPYYYPGIPIPYPHSYQTSPEHIESPPSTNSDITQSELYHHLTVPLARPIAQHPPVQSMYHHQPPRNTNASVAYESHLINRTQVNNQASDYYKIYYSKNC